MKTEEQTYDVPKESIGDHLHAVARAGLGSIPIVGAAATELFQKLLGPPFERRRNKWMNQVASGLTELERLAQLNIEILAENDAFIDAVLIASQAAMRTNQEEKLDALRNAVLNAALPNPPDESTQQLFLNLLESFTVWHLRILHLFADSSKWLHDNGKPVQQYYITASLSKVLLTAFPELTHERPFYDQIIKDLHVRGLFGTDSIHAMMSGSGVYAKQTTSFGDRFLNFFLSPLAHKTSMTNKSTPDIGAPIAS